MTVTLSFLRRSKRQRVLCKSMSKESEDNFGRQPNQAANFALVSISRNFSRKVKRTNPTVLQEVAADYICANGRYICAYYGIEKTTN